MNLIQEALTVSDLLDELSAPNVSSKEKARVLGVLNRLIAAESSYMKRCMLRVDFQSTTFFPSFLENRLSLFQLSVSP